MNQIKFSHNWNNKLSLQYFTTIRKSNLSKTKYYISKVDEDFDIILNGNSHSTCTLIAAGSFVFYTIPMGLLYTDTGVENPIKLFEKFGIKRNDEVLVLTFKKLGG